MGKAVPPFSAVTLESTRDKNHRSLNQ